MVLTSDVAITLAVALRLAAVLTLVVMITLATVFALVAVLKLAGVIALAVVLAAVAVKGSRQAAVSGQMRTQSLRPQLGSEGHMAHKSTGTLSDVMPKGSLRRSARWVLGWRPRWPLLRWRHDPWLCEWQWHEGTH